MLTMCFCMSLPQFELASAITSHVTTLLGSRVDGLEADLKAVQLDQTGADRQLDAAATLLRRAYAALAAGRREAARATQALDAARHNYRAKERELRSAGDDAAKAGGQAQKLTEQCIAAEAAFEQAQDTYFGTAAPKLAQAYQDIERRTHSAVLEAITELNNLSLQAANTTGELSLSLAQLMGRADSEIDMDEFAAAARGAGVGETSALAIRHPELRGHAWITVAAGNAQQTKLQTNAKAQHRLLILSEGMLYIYPDDSWEKPDLVIDTSRLRAEDVFTVDPSLLNRPYVFAVCLSF